MSWWTHFYRMFYRWRYRKLSCEMVTDIPDHLSPAVCYVVVDQDVPWAAVLRCPCGCGETITINLVGSHPVWRILVPTPVSASLFPSVWRKRGCGSHFWLRRGRIEWAPRRWEK